MIVAHGGGHGRGLPRSLLSNTHYPELFRVTGTLLSLVFRTEDSVFCILCSVIVLRGNSVIHRGQKPASRGWQRPRRASLPGFPCSSLSGTLLRVTGPLLSLVLRTDDMWQKRETKVIEVAGSQSGFPKKPFSPLMSICVQFLAQRWWIPFTSGVWWGWGWGRFSSDWGWVMLLRTCVRSRTNIPKTFRSSQSRFPLLAPTMQAVQDSDGGGGCPWGNVEQHSEQHNEQYAACSGCVVGLSLVTWTVVETFLNTRWWNFLLWDHRGRLPSTWIALRALWMPTLLRNKHSKVQNLK